MTRESTGRSGRARLVAPLAACAVAGALWGLATPATSPPRPDDRPVAATGRTNQGCVQPGYGQGSCHHTFGVTVGTVAPVFPGARRSVPLTFSNPNRFRIVVVSATTSVTSTSPSTCAASWLATPAGARPFSPRVSVAPRGTARAGVPVSLRREAPQSCERTTFALTVTATAVKK